MWTQTCCTKEFDITCRASEPPFLFYQLNPMCYLEVAAQVVRTVVNFRAATHSTLKEISILLKETIIIYVWISKQNLVHCLTVLVFLTTGSNSLLPGKSHKSVCWDGYSQNIAIRHSLNKWLTILILTISSLLESSDGCLWMYNIALSSF